MANPGSMLISSRSQLPLARAFSAIKQRLENLSGFKLRRNNLTFAGTGSTAKSLPAGALSGIVVRDRFSAYNRLPTQQRKLCWAHLIRELNAIADRPGASAEFGAELLGLQRQLFDHWHRYKD